MVLFGEDVRDWGGSYAVTRGFTEAIPYHRFFNSAIAEAAIVGAAIGYAMSGGRLLPRSCTATSWDGLGDELFNQLSKCRA